MRWLLRVVAFTLVLGAAMGNAQQAPLRVALVIGNATYTMPRWALVNPVNDATLIAARLRSLGFQVDPVMNANKATMDEAIKRFGTRLKTGGREAVGVFYYAGHGAQKDGVNFLVPVDATAATMEQLSQQAPAMQAVMNNMSSAGNRVNIVILDACRNTPLPPGARSTPRRNGLADLSNPPLDALIAYATRAGSTAPDNPTDRNSVFTRTLAEAFARQSRDPVELLFSDVQSRVYDLTDGAQRPEFYPGLIRAPRWSLAAAATAPSAKAQPPAPPRVTPAVARDQFNRAAATRAQPTSQSCIVVDPTGTPLNVRSFPRGDIVGSLANDVSVQIHATTRADNGAVWANVTFADTGGISAGWVYYRYLRCQP